MIIPAPYKRYNGGKSGQGTYQQIINFIPPMGTYIEPFVGNGGMLRNMTLPNDVMINDLDTDVVYRWKEVLKKNKSICGLLVFNRNGIELIKNYSGHPKSVFIYADPPYMHSTRKGGNKPLYRFEWQDSTHIEFLKTAGTCNCNVMISHPDCKLYRTYLKGWYTHDFQRMTSNGLMWDRIWMNYPPPVIRQDYRYLGKDYREREIIKR